MRTYHPQYLKEYVNFVISTMFLLVLDRDSHWLWKNRQTFAQEHAGICPDIMCVGKAITGGYLTLAAVISTKKCRKCHQWWTNRLFHARTNIYGKSSSLCCKCSEFRDYQSWAWETRVHNIEKILQRSSNHGIRSQKIKEIRVLGAVGVIEIEQSNRCCFVSKEFCRFRCLGSPFWKIVVYNAAIYH